MTIRIKHKLAWWFRRWANKLEPQAQTHPKPLLYRGKEYELSDLRVLVDSKEYGGIYHNMQIGAAKAQIAEAVEKLIEVQHFAPDRNQSIVQLLILTPKDNVYESTQ